MKCPKFRNVFYLSFIFFTIFGCNKNQESNDSGILVNEIQPKIDNSVDSLAIVDYIDCGNISIGGDYNYDENGKIYYQYGTSRYTSDGRFVYLSEDGVEIGALECEGGEEVTETINSSDNQNVEKQKQWVNCEDCQGAGLKLCYKCGGKGEYFCGSCHGTGSKSSTTGPFTCVDCNGRGVASCRECYGKGTSGNCNYCKGRGQVLIQY
jgi:hypothetical protein